MFTPIGFRLNVSEKTFVRIQHFEKLKKWSGDWWIGTYPQNPRTTALPLLTQSSRETDNLYEYKQSSNPPFNTPNTPP